MNMINFEQAFLKYFEIYGEDFYWYMLINNQEYFEHQAKTEIREGHPCYGRTLHAIARCSANDDVLYTLDDDTFVILHLTFTRNHEDKYPRTVFFSTTEEVLAYIERCYIAFYYES